MQSRKKSLIEAFANVFVGYAVAVASQSLVFPIFGIKTSALEQFQIAGYFTAISLARTYGLRRVFNAFERRGKHGERDEA